LAMQWIGDSPFNNASHRYDMQHNSIYVWLNNNKNVIMRKDAYRCVTMRETRHGSTTQLEETTLVKCSCIDKLDYTSCYKSYETLHIIYNNAQTTPLL
jgi:hypothetical protein